MEKQFRNELDQIRLSEQDKKALVQSLTAPRTQKAAPRSRMPLRVAAVAAAAVCVLIVGVSAGVIHDPVVGEFFGSGAGYQQSAVTVGESLTRDGWTLTLTDCVGDDYNLYIGFELTAPEGTVLDKEKMDRFQPGGYFFETCSVDFLPPDMYGSWICSLVDDRTLPDNVLHFIVWYEYYGDITKEKGLSMSGQPLEVTIGRLCHNTVWHEEGWYWEREYDCQVEWTFQTSFTYPDNAIRVEPDMPVTTLGVEAAISWVEVTPIGVYVHIEGDALKGHHSWVPKNAPDGWYSCIEYQEITLHTIDGEAIPLTDGLSGSGCSGGEYDTEEEPWLQLTRRSGTLLDLDTLESVSICGVEIPLR